jgi:hypothetical protein
VAAQGGEVDNEADGLTKGKVESRCCVLPDGDGDSGEPFVEWLGGVGMLSEDGMDLGMDFRFPVGVDGDVEEDPASWSEEWPLPLDLGMVKISGRKVTYYWYQC